MVIKNFKSTSDFSLCHWPYAYLEMTYFPPPTRPIRWPITGQWSVLFALEELYLTEVALYARLEASLFLQVRTKSIWVIK